MKTLNKIQDLIFDVVIENPHSRVVDLWFILRDYRNTLMSIQEISKELQFLKKEGYIERSKRIGLRWTAIIPF